MYVQQHLNRTTLTIQTHQHLKQIYFPNITAHLRQIHKTIIEKAQTWCGILHAHTWLSGYSPDNPQNLQFTVSSIRLIKITRTFIYTTIQLRICEWIDSLLSKHHQNLPGHQRCVNMYKKHHIDYTQSCICILHKLQSHHFILLH